MQSPYPEYFPATGFIVRNPDIVHSSVDGDVVMMSPDQGEYFGFDAVGSRIWNLLENPMQVGELCRVLAEDFDVEPERCRRDVDSFLGEIRKHGLIRVTP